MIDGKWIEVEGESLYHSYKRANNYSESTYVIKPRHPIILSWDFNIADGKPLSVVLMQYYTDYLHIFDEVVIHGMRTQGSCEEIAGKGYFDKPEYTFLVTGDAAGKHRDTRSLRSDYDIIEKYISNYGKGNVKFDTLLPNKNPPIKTRHNLVNGYCENVHGKHRLTCYSSAPTADKALRLTKLKASGSYTEDDTKDFQHIGTALGYGLNMAKNIYTAGSRSSIVR